MDTKGMLQMGKDMLADKTLYVKRIADTRLEEILQNTLTGMIQGRVLRLITDNRNAKVIVPVLCINYGYSIISSQENGDGLHFLIRR